MERTPLRLLIWWLPGPLHPDVQLSFQLLLRSGENRCPQVAHPRWTEGPPTPAWEQPLLCLVTPFSKGSGSVSCSRSVLPFLPGRGRGLSPSHVWPRGLGR